MENKKLISFDLKAEFGFLKKPDINDGLYLTYNMLHKPVLIGILGAIIGLQGYQENGKFPEYYNRLKDLKVGISPLCSDKGNFQKDIVKYNNGTGFASAEAGGNLIVAEQMLIKPSYRCYLFLDMGNDDEKYIYDYLKNNRAEFLPYLGKNDFSAWWDNFVEYKFSLFDFSTDYKISSIFSKTNAVSQYVVKSMSVFSSEEPVWLYFEKLPMGFDEKLYQYYYGDFVYSNATFKAEMNMSDTGCFYRLQSKDTNKNDFQIIQLFA